MIFDPEKGGGGQFYDIFDPPPPSSAPPPLKVQTGFQVWGGGGSGPKTHWGMRLLDKIMILQGVKLTIQPLEVGYADRPKKAQKGGYMVFSHIYGPA